MKRLKSLLPFALALALLLTGCSASESYNTGGFESGSMTSNTATEDYAPEDSGALGVLNTELSSPNLEEKLIYTADITVETLDYDKAVSSVNDYIKELHGFVESSEFSSDSGYDRYEGYTYTGPRRAYITARVPSERYNDFLNRASDWGLVQNQHSYLENITAQYNDTSMLLQSLEIQHDRLLDMLEQATQIDDMIRIEDSLSSVRYQINSVKSQLKNWDNEVSYSTVNITLNEVTQYSPTQKDGFFVRIAKAFKNGIKEYGEFIEDFAVFTVHSLPFIATVIVLIIVFRKPIKKHRAAVRNRKNMTETDDNDGK